MSGSDVDAKRVQRAREAAQLLEHPLLREAALEIEHEQMELSVAALTLADREDARQMVRALRLLLARLRRSVDDVTVRPPRHAA